MFPGCFSIPVPIPLSFQCTLYYHSVYLLSMIHVIVFIDVFYYFNLYQFCFPFSLLSFFQGISQCRISAYPSAFCRFCIFILIPIPQAFFCQKIKNRISDSVQLLRLLCEACGTNSRFYCLVPNRPASCSLHFSLASCFVLMCYSSLRHSSFLFFCSLPFCPLSFCPLSFCSFPSAPCLSALCPSILYLSALYLSALYLFALYLSTLYLFALFLLCLAFLPFTFLFFFLSLLVFLPFVLLSSLLLLID